MSYRNILVYLNDAHKAPKIVQHAAELARAFEARLVGLHVTVERGFGSPPAIEGLTFSRNEEADHLRAIFEVWIGVEKLTTQTLQDQCVAVPIGAVDPCRFTVLQGLMPALDLALGLRMMRRTAHVIHAVVIELFCEIDGDVARTVVAQQAWFVDDAGLVAA